MKNAISLFSLLNPLFIIFSSFYGVYAWAVDWTITDLGTLGGTYSQVYDINARGHVVGYSGNINDDEHAFIYDGVLMRDLGTLSGTYSQAVSINTRGDVVGSSYISGDATLHAFFYDGIAMSDLGTLGGSNSQGTGINDSRQIVGISQTNGDISEHAFLHNGTTITDLGTLGGENSVAWSINNSNQLVGASQTNSGTAYRAFLRKGNTMYDLGTLGGSSSVATNINSNGHVVGHSATAGDAAEHAFIYDGTSMQDLGTLGGSFSGTFDINIREQIVGYSSTTGNTMLHGFLYERSMRDLDNLPEVAAAGWQDLIFLSPLAINDSGQIAGTGTIGGQRHAFLLHPQTTSRYMGTVNTTSLYNLGCAQTNQSGLLILDFGQPWVSNLVPGTIFPGSRSFASISQIEYAVRAFLDGYYNCPGTGAVVVAVGTNNYGRYVQFRHGQVWGQMIARLNNYVSSSPSYRDRLAVVGATDIEIAWNTPDNSRAWVDGLGFPRSHGHLRATIRA